MNSTFFANNRKKYIDKIENNSLSIFFSGQNFQRSADAEYDFEVDKNFYYLTGINQANVIFGLVKKDDLIKEVLFIEKNDPVLIKWVGKKLEVEEAKNISGIETVQYLDSFEGFIFSSFNNSRTSSDVLKTLYLNLERRSSKDYTNIAIKYAHDFRRNYPDINIANCYDIVIGLRMYKSNEEVGLIKQSIETTKYGLQKLMESAKPGLYEYQLETYFDSYIKFNGQKDWAFKTICASGKNATILHYVNNNSILKENDLVLFDLGARTNFYVSDISRTIPVNGKFTPRQREIYQEVLNVNKKCVEYVKPGLSWIEFNKYAKELLAEACKRLGLIKEDKELIKYYFHNIGHFMGLDTHDPGLHDHKFAEGMVLTVEPGLYIEEEEIGIRIEDNVLITKDGAINLSVDIIKEIDDIEKYMATIKR